MTQDFAKIRPEPLLERKPVKAPPAWSLMFTGIVVGITIGVLACALFYLSGNIPPLNIAQPAQAPATPSSEQANIITEKENERLRSCIEIGTGTNAMQLSQRMSDGGKERPEQEKSKNEKENEKTKNKTKTKGRKEQNRPQ